MILNAKIYADNIRNDTTPKVYEQDQDSTITTN